jgi:hypothetical protein
MGKLSLIAEPLFKAVVQIPVAGGDAVPVQMTFKHRTRTKLNEFIDSRPGRTDLESFLEMVEGWELEDEFNAANVDLLLEGYIGAGLSAYQTYIDELIKQKAKN